MPGWACALVHVREPVTRLPLRCLCSVSGPGNSQQRVLELAADCTPQHGRVGARTLDHKDSWRPLLPPPEANGYTSWLSCAACHFPTRTTSASLTTTTYCEE